MKKNKLVDPVFRKVLQMMLTVKFIALILMISIVSASAETVLSNKENPLNATAEPSSAQQAQRREIRGNVKDNTGIGIPGVTVIVTGTTIGTITDTDGNYVLPIPTTAKSLTFSFVGMQTQEVTLGAASVYNVILREEALGLQEVVVVGYGQQKKESIVASIVNATGAQLAKTGATTNLARSLQGQLPGVTTIQISGEPGNEDPRILIRAQGTWNNSAPLILVDGIERPMSDINISEVESVSVLKDASATAVYGVKGAEGVILITTKRGSLGKPKLAVNANYSRKFLSKTPDKLNSYDSFIYRNQAIEYEISAREDAWGSFMPMSIVDRYKQPQSEADKYIFPDVDWPKEQLDSNASSSQVDLTVQGGSDFAKYFGGISYTHEGDLLRSGLDNGKGYKSKLDYNRFNFRTNLDFNVTRTTLFSVNLSGYVGTKWGGETVGQDIWRPFYQSAPSMYPVRFPDGAWGYYPFTQIPNPIYLLNNNGAPKYVRTQVTTDFILKQDLDFITSGLSVRGSLSYDNRFYSSGGISDNGNAMTRFIDPRIIDKLPTQTDEDYIYGSHETSGINDYDWVMQPISYGAENSARLDRAYRRLFYQLQVNYNRKFDKHDLGVMGLVNREEYAQGSNFPTYREDWVGRITYNYDGKYLFETNAAYNGSEKFAPKYRFGFFPSVAVGWMMSNESWLKKDWLDKLKLRYSIGKVGDDSSPPRWGYTTSWAIQSGTNRTYFGNTFSPSPNDQYVITTIGNPEIHWEEATKQNIGLEMAVFKNLLNLTVDVFKDDRSNIFMSGGQRQVPNYFGANPVAANLGKTTSHGYEIELRYQKTTSYQMNYWFNWAFTHSKDKILYREDPILQADYLKAAGYQIGQNKNVFQDGMVHNWDEVYSSLSRSLGNTEKLPGDYNIVDFNADGTEDGNTDSAPYSYPSRPQNTYSFALGAEWKGFSIMAQFYGVYNVTRFYGWFTWPFSDGYKAVVMERHVDTWRPWNMDASYPAQRLNSAGSEGTRFTVDGSYMRLKNAEIAYTFTGNIVKNLGLSSARVYVNGNNLLYFSTMMDDRETNDVTNGAAYPIFRTVTFGLSVNF